MFLRKEESEESKGNDQKTMTHGYDRQRSKNKDTEAARDLGRDVLKPLQAKGLCINPSSDFDISHGCVVGYGGVEGVCTGLIQRSSKFML